MLDLMMRKKLLQMVVVRLGIDCGVVDSATHSVGGELRSVPEPEFGTVGKMGHCRKIVLEVLLIEET